MHATGDHAEALRNAQRAASMSERLFGAAHPRMAALYGNLGEITSRYISCPRRCDSAGSPCKS